MLKIFQLSFLSVFLIFFMECVPLKAQSSSSIYGTVSDSTGRRLSFATVSVPALNKGTTTDESGNFKLVLPAGNYEIQVSLLGYQSIKMNLNLAQGEKKQLQLQLRIAVKELEEVTVTERLKDINRIPGKDFELLPNPAGSLESLIKTMPGVSSANELSSKYSVRGGNFDENLVYVNDIEIYRPFLVRTGQQEGLSFINPDLVSSIRFSAGGFEARYGDKMSSVLDISYRTPQKAAAGISLSLLGGSVFVEGLSKNNKLSVITGLRYKTTKLLLSSLDSKGEYEPNFIDWQMMLNYKLAKRLNVGFLGNYARNSYTFIPQTRNTNFGTFANIYNLKIYYDGREDDKYNSLLGALWGQYQLNPQISMKLLVNAYSVYEQEKYDISGEYLINELDAYAGSPTSGDSILNIGVGAMINHARNYLAADIWSATYSGSGYFDSQTLTWAIRYQQDAFQDQFSEWNYIDSAGFSSPYSEQQIVLNDFASSENKLTIERISAFLQDAIQWNSLKASYTINAGLRFHAWSLTNEKLWSPRVRFSVKPEWNRDVVFYGASGIYYQPPLYKEFRNFKGELNKDIKAQKSIHFLAGSDIMLSLWDRPFKYTVETYYKFLDNLIPYKLDNVRIKYTAQNNAKGYATGLDMKLYGEFVQGVESWASLSLLSTREDLKDDYYINKAGERVEPGYYHRPTDQLFHINLFFQDYLPNNPTLKASLNLVYGSSFFVAPPRTARFDATYPLGSYRRVDVGFSKTFSKKLFPQLKSFWIGVEVFNLFDIRNKASFMWIQTVGNQENVPNLFAVPNYLTSRRLNVRMTLKF